MSDHTDTLQKLHTRLIDSRDGYRESRKQVSDEAAFVGFFDQRIDAVTGDDEAVYDEIVNGESALVENYDDAIKATAGRPGYEFLTEQRASVQRAIDEAKAEKARHAVA